mgnify:CR=1 FL=1
MSKMLSCDKNFVDEHSRIIDHKSISTCHCKECIILFRNWRDQCAKLGVRLVRVNTMITIPIENINWVP